MSPQFTNIKHSAKSTLAILAMLFMSACSAENTALENTLTENSTAIEASQNSDTTLATAATESTSVIFETTAGNFTIELNAEKAPLTVANFLQYVESGFYNGTIFHRVIGNFMIQGGGFTAEMTKKSTRQPIINEADNGLTNDIGTIAMARTNVPHSATSQFFINVADNSSLNHSAKNSRGWGYAVFGQVTEGLSVIEAIKAVPTGRMAGHQNVPLEAVIIERVFLANK